MTERPAESDDVHTRVLRVTLAEPECRAYWQNVDLHLPVDQRVAAAFEQRWFGARTMPRVRTLMATLSQRFDATPEALAALHSWRSIPAETRVIVCHWHMQFSDPVYRAFTGDYLVQRRVDGRTTIDRDQVERWVHATWKERWAAATRVKFAGNLLTAAGEAGLVGRTNPRTIATPRVPDEALAYLLHLLREVRIGGTILKNPYLASVGLDAESLAPRLAALRDVHFRRLGDVVDFEWASPNLRAWAEQVEQGRHA
ncbi:DUF1819 domain-containing protein [Gemmatimonas sp.]|uniref:DUF1819 domain-containing protein n=1 Tax=Gemmatimonas sp. TaxID=1962908 RepID=UPI00398311EF